MFESCFKCFLGCDLRLVPASNKNPEDEIIRTFETEFESKKRECAVLIVHAPGDSGKWTVAGFNDKEEFRTVVIDDSNADDLKHELSKELKKKEKDRNKCRLVKLATSNLGRSTPCLIKICTTICSIKFFVIGLVVLMAVFYGANKYIASHINKLQSEGCNLCLMSASDGNPEDEIIRKFETEFESKKRECAVLVVHVPGDSGKWTVAGFNDEGKFRTVVIDDPNHELSKEPRNKYRIVELATSKLGCTPGESKGHLIAKVLLILSFIFLGVMSFFQYGVLMYREIKYKRSHPPVRCWPTRCMAGYALTILIIIAIVVAYLWERNGKLFLLLKTTDWDVLPYKESIASWFPYVKNIVVVIFAFFFVIIDTIA